MRRWGQSPEVPDRQDVAGFETAQAGGFVDMLWPEVCVIEMKAPRGANRLDKHRPQALNYWRNTADAAARVPSARGTYLRKIRTKISECPDGRNDLGPYGSWGSKKSGT